MKIRNLALPAVLALALNAGWGATLAQAQTPAQPASPAAPTKLALSADARMDSRGRPVKGQLVLSATLTSAAGKPINGKIINFYQQVELMGQHDAFIGTATTDATGVAALLYEPAQVGAQQLKARFPGTPDYAAQDAAAAVTIKDAVPPFQGEPLPLATVATGLSYGAGLLVLGVWAVLLGVLLRTVWAIRRAAGKPPART